MALEPPRIADSIIVEALDKQYDFSVVALIFLPIGNDPASWVYRAEAGEGRTLFLKVRAGNGFSTASLRVPYILQQQGLPHVLAPLPARDGTLWISLEDHVLALYPFIEGQNGADVGLTNDQWQAFGTLVAQIHACRLPHEVLRRTPREAFVPSRRELMGELEKVIHRGAFADDLQQEAAAFWASKQEVIGTLVARADALGDELRTKRAPDVLCHADMHPWNLLVEEDGTWWLIDWDEVVVALKERDLMFVVGGIGGDGVGAEATEVFLEGYGGETVDARALSYYRTAWAVQDIAAYGEALFISPKLSEASGRAALEGFVSLFATGNIAERALGQRSE